MKSFSPCCEFAGTFVPETMSRPPAVFAGPAIRTKYEAAGCADWDGEEKFVARDHPTFTVASLPATFHLTNVNASHCRPKYPRGHAHSHVSLLTTPPLAQRALHSEQRSPAHCARGLHRHLQEESNSPPFSHTSTSAHSPGTATFGKETLSSNPASFAPRRMRPYPASPHRAPQLLAKSQ